MPTTKSTKESLQAGLASAEKQIRVLQEELLASEARHKEECKEFVEKLRAAEVNYVELEKKYGNILQELCNYRDRAFALQEMCDKQLSIIERMARLIP